MRRFITPVLLVLVIAVPSSSDEKKGKREPDPLMMTKLKESQTLLEGLTTNDLGKVEKSAEELLKISKMAQVRKALKTPAYDVYANNFQRSAETVIEKAKAKNLDGAALAYVDLTMTCIRCHQYTREQGLGRLQPRLDSGDGIGR